MSNPDHDAPHDGNTTSPPGDATEREQSEGKSLEDRILSLFSDPRLILVFGLLLVCAALASIHRDARTEQFAAVFEEQWGDRKQIRVVYPRILPTAYDDPRGLPLLFRQLDHPSNEVMRSCAVPPGEMRVRTDPPLMLLDTDGEPQSGLLTFEATQPTHLLYLRHEPPSQQTSVDSVTLHLDLFPLKCTPIGYGITPRSGYSDPVTTHPLEVSIYKESWLRSYGDALLSFFENPEVWGSLVVALIGGAITLQLRKQEEQREIERAESENERAERIEDRKRLERQEEREKERRDDERRRLFMQEADAIRRLLLKEEVLEAINAYDILDQEVGDKPESNGSLDRLRSDLFSENSLQIVLRQANDAIAQGRETEMNKKLRTCERLQLDEESILGEALSFLARCNMDDGCVENEIEAADALLKLWREERYEYTELIARGLERLWKSGA